MTLLFKGRNRVTSCFRRPDRPDHHGIDIVGDDSRDILCPIDGTVKSSTMVDRATDTTGTWEWGNYVRVDDAEGNRYYFCHMASRAVVAGQQVKKGDKLGVMGNTGLSSGAHTHFEIRKANNSSRIDPAAFLGIPNQRGTYALPDGWIEENGKWHFFKDGEMAKSQWVKTNGIWYYLDDEGAALTGWHKVKHRKGIDWFYFLTHADAVKTGGKECSCYSLDKS